MSAVCLTRTLVTLERHILTGSGVATTIEGPPFPQDHAFIMVGNGDAGLGSIVRNGELAYGFRLVSLYDPTTTTPQGDWLSCGTAFDSLKPVSTDSVGNIVTSGSTTIDARTWTWDLVIYDNHPPDANAGADLPVSEDEVIRPGDTVTLTGIGRDPDNEPLTFKWSQTSGEPPVTLNGAETQTITFTAPDVDTETQFTFDFTVTDSRGASDTDSVTVTVTPGDFSIACDPFNPAKILPGESGKTNCTIGSVDGFDKPVNIDCVSLVTQITCGTNPNPVTPPTDGEIKTELLVSFDITTPRNPHTMTVTGTSGDLLHRTTVDLECAICFTPRTASQVTSETERKILEDHEGYAGQLVDKNNNNNPVVCKGNVKINCQIRAGDKYGLYQDNKGYCYCRDRSPSL